MRLELELAARISLHTQRAQSSKELAIILLSPKHKDSETDQIQKIGRSKRTKQAAEQEKEDHIASLRSHSEALTKAMMMACKPKNAVALKQKANLTIPGAHLLLHSSWNWPSIHASSRSRDFHHISAASVLEFYIIAEYREDLIQSISAASFLRLSLGNAFEKHLKKSSTFMRRGETAGRSACNSAEFTFPDEISLDASDEIKDSFEVSEELPLWKDHQDRKDDQMTVQKIVCAVEKTCLAWQDPFNVDVSKCPPLNAKVQEALEGLIRVSSIARERESLK